MLRCLVVLSLAVSSVLACEAPRSAPVCEPGMACGAAAAADDARCLVETRLYGRTAQPDGRCSASDARACEASAVTCAVWGQCSVPSAQSTGGGCTWNESDRDLQAAREPACEARGVTCVAGSDGDCQASRGCRLEGRCKAEGGICVATQGDCKKAELCAALGWCAPSRTGGCRAGTVADCEQASTCTSQGECGLAKEHCVTCAESDGCRADGRCERVDTTCLATRSADCQKSEGCKRKGRCKASQGACVR